MTARARVLSDMKAWVWLLSGVCAAGGLLLSGCGAASAPKPMVSALAGNWLLVGPMPTSSLGPTPTGTRLAVTFDVNGNNIVAAGVVNDFCVNVGFGSPGIPVIGSVAADGSFTLTMPPNSLGEVSIRGTVPPANGGPWPGSYTVSLTSPFPPKCNTNLSGTFTAMSFPLIDGVYVGTGGTQATVNGVSTATQATFQVTLQQGATVMDTTGKPLSRSSALLGSIRVQGSPCFTSGVTDSTHPGKVEGNRVDAIFTMDDGSTLVLLGSLADATETRLTENAAIVTGGQCAINGPLIYQLPELDRQSQQGS